MGWLARLLMSMSIQPLAELHHSFYELLNYYQPKFIDYLIRGIMGLLAKDIVVDAKNHAELLKASNLEWMIVRAPRLTLNPRKGTYRIGWVGVNSGTELSREDLADFIIKQIEKTDFKFQMPFVSY